jgi:hypothetical protein
MRAVPTGAGESSPDVRQGPCGGRRGVVWRYTSCCVLGRTTRVLHQSPGDGTRRASFLGGVATPCYTLDACHNSGRFLQQLYAKGHGGGGGRDGRRCREGRRLGRAGRREDEVKPAPASRLRAEGLGAGEAQVEAEGDEVKLPVEEPRTATTL